MVVFVTTGKDSLLRPFHEELGLLLTRAKIHLVQMWSLLTLVPGDERRERERSRSGERVESFPRRAAQTSTNNRCADCSTVVSDVSKGITRIIMGHVLGQAMDF